MSALNYDAISAKEKDRYYSRKSAGLCVACGKPLDTNYIRCKACHAKMMEDNRKRIAEKKAAVSVLTVRVRLSRGKQNAKCVPQRPILISGITSKSIRKKES